MLEFRTVDPLHYFVTFNIVSVVIFLSKYCSSRLSALKIKDNITFINRAM